MNDANEPVPKSNCSSLTAPIPFINIDNNSNALHVSPIALGYLNSLESKIAIVSIAGMYRTGKSFLLSKLLSSDESSTASFSIGSTVQACTKGIWMHTLPASGKYKHLPSDAIILYLDTEGLGSMQRNQSHDSRIFALALLLSSYFVYNSRGVIDSNAIDELSLVIDLSKFVRVQANRVQHQEQTDLEVELNKIELADFLPDFLWVVRDFSLQLKENGKKITARKYLESALKPQDIVNEQSAEKNRTRALLTDSFRSRDCVVMVRPVHDEKILRNLIDQPYDTLREEFRAQVKELQDKICNTLKPKQMMNTPLNGVMFARITECYIDAFNSGVVPVITSAWDRVLEFQFNDALQSSKNTFAGQIWEIEADKSILSEEEISTLYEQARDLAQKKLMREIVFPESRINYSLQLSYYTISQLKEIYEQNEQRSIKHNQKLLESIHGSLSLESCYTGKIKDAQALDAALVHSRKKFEALIERYREKAYGPQQDMILGSFLIKHVIDDLCEWSTALKNAFREQELQYQTKINIAKQSLRVKESKARAALEILEQQKVSYEGAIQSILERAKNERQMLRSEIDSKQNEILCAREQLEKLTHIQTKILDRMKAQIARQVAERKRIEECSREAKSRTQSARLASRREVLETERSFYKEEKELRQIQQDLLGRLLELERQLGEQETAQMKELFNLEKESKLEKNQFVEKMQKEEADIKSETIKSIRMIKEEGENQISALDTEFDEKKAYVASLKEQIMTKEALVSSKRIAFTSREECSLQ